MSDWQDVTEKPAENRFPREWMHLILKLRWIGLDDDARRLETAVGMLPPKDRGSALVSPFHAN